MSPEVAVLLALLTTLLAVGVPLVVKELKELRTKNEKITNRQTRVESYLEILLDHSGFDMHKVKSKIREHQKELEELQTNGSPSIGGCINPKELYKDK